VVITAHSTEFVLQALHLGPEAGDEGDQLFFA
jgi:hypothetical protein